MSIPATTVEIGFDLSALGGPFFILDDAVQGVLDNTEYTLGGTLFYDVSNFVRNVSVRRGKSRQLDRFTAGGASIELNNNDRAFDPENTSSPFFGQIIPKRTIKVETGGSAVFYGVVDDWNLNYDISGLSVASADCVDGFTLLSQRALSAHTATVELSGARVNAVLDRSEVNWPASLRDIDNGATTLQADVVEDGTNVYEYLQLVSDSEPGAFFMGADGFINYRDRTVAPVGSGVVVFSDDGSGVPFSNVQIVYGSELLFNYIQIERNNGGTAIVFDSDSINSYGQQALIKSNLLMNTDADALELANYLLGQYSEPEYRFETLTVQLEALSSIQQDSVLGLEIGNVAEIKFTPNNVGSQIDKYASIIRIDHDIRSDSHSITFGFETLDYASLVLDDLEFGILDTNRLGF
jgi:hypothetical protein